ncbi:MAG TPA: HsdR family type I site-specific deoxyribonuclease [Candidatus Krumholzibacteria bacterium]|nr:HsdR family type I site-specific deoxyribonuclease [Candidatus Krumholzibacteria bacterium]HRY42048.1 HsdR family type I site-specific deoxyribonuclease [Candidatus Krumholzibacteria bacterium]
MREDHASQVPALQVLQNLGWEYLSPAEALAARGGREAAVLLDRILEVQLRHINAIRFKGDDFPFSEGNIHTAVRTLKDVLFDGLVRTNEKVYDLLCLGKSLPQTIEGDTRSFTLHYIDWKHPERNVYHVTEEFSVAGAGPDEPSSTDEYFELVEGQLKRRRPDIVLFVNGIPMVVIECKRPDLGPGKDPIEQAISQQIRNQKDDGIPKLFTFVQMLLAVSANGAKYGTVGTPMKFWACWREREDREGAIRELINRPLSISKKDKLFAGRYGYVRRHFDALEAEGGREVNEQDRALWSLCMPTRLLELTYRFVLYDAGEKKIARYQQYFCVNAIMTRVRKLEHGCRRGGVVWHTQGSGKSLTMVLLAKAIALETEIANHKVVVVSDRIDLDDQIARTFKHCGIEREQATTGAHLVEMLKVRRQRVLTTVINKFTAGVSRQGVRNEDPNIFVLVDEGHRGQYGSMHAKMKKALPNACYIGFTGTPIAKKNRDTVRKFGGLIEPTYTIKDAVEDGAVVPLLYEGRHVREKVDARAIDEWFDRVTEGLTNQQKADLKQKFSTEDMIMRADPVVREIAWDVSTHFRDNWQGTPFKAQLVTPRKETALLYKKYLDEFGIVKSQILISGPDDREGEEDLYGESTDPVMHFWKSMMDKYGTEKEYNRQVINAFKHGDPTDPDADAPEVIIVVDKLTTGFDAPCNTVLYLARKLTEHTLLQAIARVNRLHDGKDFGYVIDYRGVLENLDHALDMYSNLPDYEKVDLADMLTDVRVEIAKLPQKHSILWSTFKAVKNTRDREAYERLLGDDVVRIRFYERFADYARTLGVALSTTTFLECTPEDKIEEYRRDMRFFQELRRSVRRRYAEVVDFSEYEPKIRKLLDTHIGTEGIEQITGAIDLFSKDEREKAIAGAASDEAKADTIAHNTKRVLEVKWQQEDPAFFKKFSRMLQDVIDAFRTGRLQAAEYLKIAGEIMDSVLNRTGDDVPEVLANHDVAKAYYGSIREVLAQHPGNGADVAERSAEAGLEIERIIEELRKVNWTNDTDAQNRMRQAIEDFLFEFKERTRIELSFDEIDRIMDECLGIAKVRRP